MHPVFDLEIALKQFVRLTTVGKTVFRVSHQAADEHDGDDGNDRQRESAECREPGGVGLTERSERGSLSAVATHDVFAFAVETAWIKHPSTQRNNQDNQKKNAQPLT